MTPPRVELLTTRVAAGRPLIVAEGDRRAAPASIRSRSSSATAACCSARRPTTRSAGSCSSASRPGAEDHGRQDGAGHATLPTTRRRRTSTRSATNVLPNTAFLTAKISVVTGPTVTWLVPRRPVPARRRRRGSWCSRARRQKVKQVAFPTTAKRIGVDKAGPGGIYTRRLEDDEAEEGQAHCCGDRRSTRRAARPPPLRVASRVCK